MDHPRRAWATFIATLCLALWTLLHSPVALAAPVIGSASVCKATKERTAEGARFEDSPDPRRARPQAQRASPRPEPTSPRSVPPQTASPEPSVDTLESAGTTWDDTTTGNRDRLPQPGETGHVIVRLRNTGVTAVTGITGTLEFEPAGLAELIEGTASFPDAGPGEVVTNTSPFVVKIAEDVPTVPVGGRCCWNYGPFPRDDSVTEPHPDHLIDFSGARVTLRTRTDQGSGAVVFGSVHLCAFCGSLPDTGSFPAPAAGLGLSLIAAGALLRGWPPRPRRLRFPTRETATGGSRARGRGSCG